MVGLLVPEDVLTEILSRLPVRSLLPFKCVCKSWYALIEDPSFVHKQLLFNRATVKNNDVPLIITHSDMSTYKRVLSLIAVETNEVSPHAAFQSFKQEFICIGGPCNGIYFLKDYKKEAMFLCNPVLRQLRALPNIPLIPKVKAQIIAAGFSFDFKTNDYKMVAITILGRFLIQVWVYSLSTDSWRKLNIDLKAYKLNFIGLQTHQNGFLHWLAEYESRQVLLSFNSGSEYFFETPLPVFNPAKREFVQHFTVFNESIAVIVKKDLEVSDEMEFCCDIWVMKECDGINMSWTRLFRIGPFSDILRVLALRTNGEILLENSEELVSYNPRSQEFTKKVPILGLHLAFCIVSYRESLASFNQQGNKLIKKER